MPLAGTQGTFVAAGFDRAKIPAYERVTAGETRTIRRLIVKTIAVPHDAAWPLLHPALYTLVFCALLLAAVMPLTLRRYRVRTSD